MFRLIAISLMITTAITVVLVGTHTAGNLRQVPIEQFASEHCTPQPCWRGIRPGVTSMAQTRDTLKADAVAGGHDTYQLCYQASACWSLSLLSWSADPDEPVNLLSFQPAPGAFLLGDAVNLYGNPTTSQMCFITTPTNGDLGPEVQRPLMVAYLTFRGDIKVVAYAPNNPLEQRIDPSMNVYRFYYQNGYDIFTPQWHGFSQQQKLGCNMG